MCPDSHCIRLLATTHIIWRWLGWPSVSQLKEEKEKEKSNETKKNKEKHNIHN
jgi:hypothetical protein